MKHKTTLFRRTALTMAIGLLAFQLAAVAALLLNLVFPLAQRSAEDLATLLVWSAKAWQNSTGPERKSLERELRDNYGLTIKVAERPLAESPGLYPYLQFLRNALIRRLPQQQLPRLTEDAHEQFRVEFYLQGQLLHFEFGKTRLTPQPVHALLWTLAAGMVATLLTSWLLARRITAPVKRLSVAAQRIGQGELAPSLPETGEAELAELARIFNQTAHQLQARRENQNTLLAGVSHDLRSPLARMKMALGLLAEQHSSPLIEGMERDIAAMDQLIGAQLELVRAQEAEEAKLIDVTELLHAAIAAGEALAPGRLRLKFYSTCVAKLAPVALRRCLDNLINNALRYGNDSQIDVVCRLFQQTLFLGVRDRGPGIPYQVRDAVFRPFYRIESSRNRATGGSGLGLAITRQLVETQGWQVALKPRRGGGVSAWLQIRLHDPS